MQPDTETLTSEDEKTIQAITDAIGHNMPAYDKLVKSYGETVQSTHEKKVLQLFHLGQKYPDFEQKFNAQVVHPVLHKLQEHAPHNPHAKHFIQFFMQIAKICIKVLKAVVQVVTMVVKAVKAHKAKVAAAKKAAEQKAAAAKAADDSAHRRKLFGGAVLALVIAGILFAVFKK